VPPHWKGKEIDLLIDDVEATIKDVELFKAADGQAIYEATAIDYGRDPVGLKTIAERTGIHIIATAGFKLGQVWEFQRDNRCQGYRSFRC
jgi:predicted metal-dependent phosphotriesterase family hydrolase